MVDMPPPTQHGFDEPDAREVRRAKRQERLSGRYGWIGPGIGGIVLILVGVVILAQNYGVPVPDKWWTVLLLIPAVGAFMAAWNAYRQDGRFNGQAVGSAVAGAILVVVAGALAFNFNWELLWPVLLIAVGAVVLVRTYWR